MPNRIKLALVASLTVISSLLAAAPMSAAATPQKVVIIVGPTGAQTDGYRTRGDSIAATAVAAGATAVKVYSPNATWANVKAAVNGANIVVYLGHGNGYPNPYGSTELLDRTNGWGLNRTASGGDGDDWSATMVYCGEKALLGTLTSSDGSAQWAYCGGSTNTDGITPAANWVMIYSNACYAPGASEGWDTPATESVALQRVRNYSYPALVLGASAYYATDLGAGKLVDLILRNPQLTYTDITRAGNGYDVAAQRHFTHPDLPSAEIWLQSTGSVADTNYWYAFAGNPLATPAGGVGTPLPPPGATTYSPPVTLIFKAGSHIGYQFSSSGGVTASLPYYLPSDSSASTDTRSTISGQSGYWFRVTNGIWAGYWVRESSMVYLASAPPSPPPPPPGATTYSPPVTLIFKAGSHIGYQFSSSGGVTASLPYYLPSDSSASTDTRSTISGQSGYWFRVTNGIWAGYWVRESSMVYLASAPPSPPPPPPGATTYSPPVTLIFKAGSHIGYQFSSSGGVTASLPYYLPSDSSASTDTRSTISGQSGYWFRVTNGIWAGYWVRESSMVYLASAPPSPPPPPPGATTYSPPVTLIFKAGSHIGYQFSSSGGVTASLPYYLPSDSSASTDTRSTISGQSGYWFRVTNGIWAGYWVRESSMVYLAS